jgi:hypothetical protein
MTHCGLSRDLLGPSIIEPNLPFAAHGPTPGKISQSRRSLGSGISSRPTTKVISTTMPIMGRTELEKRPERLFAIEPKGCWRAQFPQNGGDRFRLNQSCSSRNRLLRCVVDNFNKQLFTVDQ